MSKANTQIKKATILAKKIRKTVAFFPISPCVFQESPSSLPKLPQILLSI